MLDGAAEADAGRRPAAGADPAAPARDAHGAGGPAGPRGADRGAARRRRSALRRALHRGGRRVRADPGAAGQRGPGDGAPPPHQPGEAAPGPRDAAGARHPAQPLPAFLARRSTGSRWRRRTGRTSRWAATTTTSSRWTGGRVALAIADVSGKGTPASILMASVHASLRALAGTSTLPVLMTRLNRFLYDNTEANRYVTLFYGELDATPAAVRVRQRRARPAVLVVRAGGAVDRLESGGPVLGLLDEVGFECGEVLLAPGDVLAMVTDGATEALSPGRRGVRRRARRGRALDVPPRARGARAQPSPHDRRGVDGRHGMHRRPDRVAPEGAYDPEPAQHAHRPGGALRPRAAARGPHVRLRPHRLRPRAHRELPVAGGHGPPSPHPEVQGLAGEGGHEHHRRRRPHHHPRRGGRLRPALVHRRAHPLVRGGPGHGAHGAARGGSRGRPSTSRRWSTSSAACRSAGTPTPPRGASTSGSPRSRSTAGSRASTCPG